ncbi:MAG: SDR family oxidoreductase [Rhodospirillaceae bacterium]|nr:SDR family oxidoreductase [Rhodospirillaceae bacterium]
MKRRDVLACGLAALALGQASKRVLADGQKGRVLILGATGRIGRFIAETIRADGYTVRATTRNVERAKRRIPGDYEWVQADVRDPRTLVEPLRDVDYVVSSIRSSQWVGGYNPEFVDYHGMQNLVGAAKAAGVKHFVLISTATSGPQVDQTKNPAKNYVRYFKTKGEEVVRASGLRYTIIAPGRVPEEPGGEIPFILLDRKDYYVSIIKAGDVALAALDALTNPAARGKAFGLRNEPGVALGHWRTQYAEMPDR